MGQLVGEALGSETAGSHPDGWPVIQGSLLRLGSRENAEGGGEQTGFRWPLGKWHSFGGGDFNVEAGAGSGTDPSLGSGTPSSRYEPFPRSNGAGECGKGSELLDQWFKVPSLSLRCSGISVPKEPTTFLSQIHHSSMLWPCLSQRTPLNS